MKEQTRIEELESELLDLENELETKSNPTARESIKRYISETKAEIVKCRIAARAQGIEL